MPLQLDRYSINTATLGYQSPISETIEAVARKGFGGIAPWRREVEGENVREVAHRIRDAGLRVSGYCRSSYLPAASREGWLANIEDNRRALRDAAELRAECFVLVVGGLAPASRDLDGARRQVQDGIEALLPDAISLGVPLAIEPLHPMYAADRACVNTIEQALDICAALDPSGSGALGVAVDVYHTWWDPRLRGSLARTGAEGRFLAFHINDWLAPTTDLLMDRGMVGEGVIDIGAISRNVLEAGYDGLLEVEVFSERIWKMPPNQILDVCARSCREVMIQFPYAIREVADRSSADQHE